MIYNQVNGWFIFKFESCDYHRYGKLNIDAFLKALQEVVPPVDRNYYGHKNEWQIRDKYKEEFNRLFDKHCNKSQLSLF